MSPMNISIESLTLSDPNQNIKLVRFAGQLDETNVDEKSEIIYNLIAESPESTSYVFEFSELEYMNSKSIGYLTDWYSKVMEKNGKLVIAKARENIVDVLNVVGLSQIIPMCMTVDEAKLEVMK